jgi:hypothetical protein
VGLAAVAVVGTALPASAGVPTLTVTPGTLPVGGTITVSNSSCLGGTVEVGLWGGTTAGNALPSGSPVATNTATPDGTGAWSTTLLVPLSAAPGAYTVHGSCASGESDFSYFNAAVTVTPAPTTTTAACPTSTTLPATTTSSTSTSTTLLPVNARLARAADPTCPTTTPTTTPSAAAPATAVPATPTFTG